ncbi:MAG: hypothetical protein Q7R47_02535, partial [Candidatus Diapherotrites archaeon]|nr:hypothetical protein [Candidatus Diapherotrites archaeon]
TQFSIELSKKLDSIMQAAEDNPPVAADSPLLDFNAYLFKDGYSVDFRQDFEFVQASELVSPNAAYQHIKPYFLDEERLVLPQSIPVAGKYHVQVVLGFATGKSNVFFESDQPVANIIVSAELLEPSTNPFYYWPVDYRLGAEKRPDETASGRTGYGIGFLQALQVSADTLLKPVSSNFGPTFDIDAMTPISRVLSPDRRGVVLEVQNAVQNAVQNQNSHFIWTATKATPVMFSATMQNNSASAFFQLTQNGSPVPLGSSPIGNWTGAGSTMGSACTGFDTKPLLSNGPEPVLDTTNTCAKGTTDARGFLWTGTTGTADGKSVYYKSVVYTPSGNFALQKAAGCSNGFELLSPAGLTSSSAPAVTLGYFDGGGISSLQGLADAVKNQWLCLGPIDSGTLVFWNKTKVLDALSNPQNFTPNPAHAQKDFALGPASICTPAS